MINTVIFSYNRALQLRLLLESIKKYIPDILNINIIYKSGSNEFESGYNKLISENILSNINWVKEVDFKKQVIELIANNEYELTTFMTDDDIIYKPLNMDDIVQCMEDEENLCFSCRLGENVSVCYTMQSSNLIIPLSSTENTLTWDWTKHYFDTGYPLSVDFHIFRTKDIVPLCKAISFHNPNTFEGNLQIFNEHPKYKMTSFKHSVMVNTPNNIVNETHPNRKGETFGITAEELNNKYLNGEIIDLESLDFSNVRGCHQEIEYKYINEDIRYLQNGLFNSIKNV